jgi:hypothetical protein
VCDQHAATRRLRIRIHLLLRVAHTLYRSCYNIWMDTSLKKDIIVVH